MVIDEEEIENEYANCIFDFNDKLHDAHTVSPVYSQQFILQDFTCQHMPSFSMSSQLIQHTLSQNKFGFLIYSLNSRSDAPRVKYIHLQISQYSWKD